MGTVSPLAQENSLLATLLLGLSALSYAINWSVTREYVNNGEFLVLRTNYFIISLDVVIELNITETKKIKTQSNTHYRNHMYIMNMMMLLLLLMMMMMVMMMMMMMMMKNMNVMMTIHMMMMMMMMVIQLSYN